MPDADRPVGPRSRVPGEVPIPTLPLAYGDLSAADAAELALLKTQIRADSGFLCQAYKEKCLRRRIAVRMRARGVHAYADYRALLTRDPDEYERLLAALTINVTKFFRNAEVWHALRDRVLPALFDLRANDIRIWSAGCASGEEPYTVAMLVREHAEATGRLADLRRFSIMGTDIDREALASARRSEYSELALQETDEVRRNRWFKAEAGHYKLDPAIRSMVRFQHHDLLSDAPLRKQHLIICRNVIIYFERGVQESLFQTFAEAILPQGFLILGKVETLFGEAASKFRIEANPERVFRRL